MFPILTLLLVPTGAEYVVGIPVFLCQVGVRTHLSKMLNQDEVGKCLDGQAELYLCHRVKLISCSSHAFPLT